VFDPSHVLEAEDVQIREDLTMEVPLVALEDNKVEERRGKPRQSSQGHLGSEDM